MSTMWERLVAEGFLPDVLADASPGARAELEHGCFHLFQLCGRRFQPSLGAKFVDVFAEDFWSAVQDPCVAAYDGATGDVFS